ncbi:FG-GAP-like repeat-containing protein [Pelomonas sp. KK5]|uniref:FG-GAP-like repeat-containing protein n=1 Tax=Pelomonas sp. KK5 TaxID=1855730 RepID=UPI0009F89E60|nr:FG-GAP-like repeat-containing protein [Pelomonas sp. KK5]
MPHAENDRSFCLAARMSKWLNERRAIGLSGVLPLFVLAMSGAAQAQLPGGLPAYAKAINIPPIAGASPKLALAYTAGTVNGPIGYGWGLRGISMIVRCQASLATDKIVTPITFGPEDKLCLDEQRLIQVNPMTGAVINGSFPTAGSATPFQKGDAMGQAEGRFIEFRTERDASIRIRSYGYANGSASSGPAYFRVWTKSGKIYSYGADPDVNSASSALVLQSSQGTAGAPGMVWAVARILDVKGDAIDYKYLQSDVAWGSGPGAGVSTVGHEWNVAEVDYGPNKVVFNYGPRAPAGTTPSDGVEAYQQGFKNVGTLLLQSVTSFAGATPVSTLNVRYTVGPVSGRSRVSSLQDCPGNSDGSKCVTAATFAYADGGNDNYAAHTGFAASGLATTQMTRQGSGRYGALIGDFDGDGRMDILRWSDTPAENQLWMSRNEHDVDTFVRWPTDDQAHAFNLTDVNLSKSDGCFASMVADFNGDGFADILRVATHSDRCAGEAPNLLYLSKGDGSFKRVVVPSNLRLQQVTSVPAPGQPTGIQANFTEGENFYAIDINGDGILDLVTTILPATVNDTSSTPQQDPCSARICTHVYMGQSDGSGTFREATGTNLAHRSVYAPPIGGLSYLPPNANTGDWNGDGLADIYSSAGLWISSGDGNFTLVPGGPAGGCINPIEFNGDGRTDCLSARASSSSLSIGGSTAFAGNFNLSGVGLVGVDGLGKPNLAISTFDANGDNRDDILVRSTMPANNALWLGNGDGTFTKSTSFNLNSISLQSTDDSIVVLTGDFTGRGSVELLRMETKADGAVNNQLYTRVDEATPDQLMSINYGSEAKPGLHIVSPSSSTSHTQPAQPASARPAEVKSGWIKDQSGCDHFNASPLPGETVQWTGGCKDSLADGDGIAEWFLDGKLNTHYEGAMAKGLRQGRAILRSSRGAVYEGDYRNGQREGEGVLTQPDGGRYEGHFSGGVASGHGKFTSADGSGYEGDFRGGHAEGTGKRWGKGGDHSTDVQAMWNEETQEVSYAEFVVMLGPENCTSMPEPVRPDLGSWTGTARLVAVARMADGRVAQSEVLVLQSTGQSALDAALRKSITQALSAYKCQGNESFIKMFDFEGSPQAKQ